MCTESAGEPGWASSAAAHAPTSRTSTIEMRVLAKGCSPSPCSSSPSPRKPSPASLGCYGSRYVRVRVRVRVGVGVGVRVRVRVRARVKVRVRVRTEPQRRVQYYYACAACVE